MVMCDSRNLQLTVMHGSLVLMGYLQARGDNKLPHFSEAPSSRMHPGRTGSLVWQQVEYYYYCVCFTVEHLRSVPFLGARSSTLAFDGCLA